MTTWTNQEKFEDQESITYDEAGITYDDVLYLYDGKEPTTWTNETKN
jgi:hypothetical protein